MKKTTRINKKNSATRKAPRATQADSTNKVEKQEIAVLMKRNEFWIGAAIIFAGVILSGNALYKNFSQTNVQGEQSKKFSPTPTPVSQMKKLPGITKLANTSGLAKYLAVLPKITPTPIAEALIAPVVNSSQGAPSNSTTPASRASNNTSNTQSSPVSVVQQVSSDGTLLPTAPPEAYEEVETPSPEETIAPEPTAPEPTALIEKPTQAPVEKNNESEESQNDGENESQSNENKDNENQENHDQQEQAQGHNEVESQNDGQPEE